MSGRLEHEVGLQAEVEQLRSELWYLTHQENMRGDQYADLKDFARAQLAESARLSAENARLLVLLREVRDWWPTWKDRTHPELHSCIDAALQGQVQACTEHRWVTEAQEDKRPFMSPKWPEKFYPRWLNSESHHVKNEYVFCANPGCTAKASDVQGGVE